MLLLFKSIEDTFNDIWGIRLGRSLLMRIVFYWTILTLGAVLFFASVALLGAGAAVNVFSESLSRLPGGANLVAALRWSLPVFSLVLIALMLALVPGISGLAAVPLLHLSRLQYGAFAGLTVYAVPQVLAATAPIGSSIPIRSTSSTPSTTITPATKPITIAAHGAIYESLVTRDKDLKLVPGLAESWETPEPTRYRFKLRKNVKFHDGTPFTADDVIFSFGRIKQPQGTMQMVLGDLIKLSPEEKKTAVEQLHQFYADYQKKKGTTGSH